MTSILVQGHLIEVFLAIWGAIPRFGLQEPRIRKYVMRDCVKSACGMIFINRSVIIGRRRSDMAASRNDDITKKLRKPPARPDN